MAKLMRVSEFADQVGVSASTVRRWEKEGRVKPIRSESGQRLFSQEHVDHHLGRKPRQPITVIYLRASSPGQKSDLKSQREAMETWAIANGTVVDEWVSDIGSGLNFRRKNLSKLVHRAVTEHQPINMIVAHKDRLARFGFELYEDILTATGGSVTVVNQESLSPTEELTQDLLAILHVFSSRLYGLRRFEKTIRAARNELADE